MNLIKCHHKYSILLFSVLASGVLSLYAGGTPHNLTGSVTIPGYGAPADDQVHFECYLTAFTGSAGDTLTEISVDCGYASGYYYVQVSNFSATWAAGMTIHIDLWEDAGGGTTFGETVLTTNAFDVLDLTILDSSLPVTLSSFSAESVTDGICLQWITESEVNNAGFILERRYEGCDWSTIASCLTQSALCGQGNTSSRSAYEFTDRNVRAGSDCQYRLSDVRTDGTVHVLDIIETTVPEVSGILSLKPPVPNPFNPHTRIPYSLSETSMVTITVFDILGKPVRQLIRSEQSAGSHHIYWDGKDGLGMPAASGTYLIRLQTRGGIHVQKALLMR